MNADGTDQTRLTTVPGNLEPVWSPGQRILFQSSRAGGWDLYVMNADGSGQTWLTVFGRINTQAWAPDRQHIVLVSQGEIYVMNADGSG